MITGRSSSDLIYFSTERLVENLICQLVRNVPSELVAKNIDGTLHRNCINNDDYNYGYRCKGHKIPNVSFSRWKRCYGT